MDVEKLPWRRRFVFPVLIVLAVSAASRVVHRLAWRFDSESLHRILATVSGTLR